MVSVANTVVNERAVVVESFNTSSTSHAVNSSGGPNSTAEETEVVKAPVFSNCFIKYDVEFLLVDWLGPARVSGVDIEEHAGAEHERNDGEADQTHPFPFVLKGLLVVLVMIFEHYEGESEEAGLHSDDGQVDEEESPHRLSGARNLLERSVLWTTKGTLAVVRAEVELELGELVLSGTACIHMDLVKPVVFWRLKEDVRFETIKKLRWRGSEVVFQVSPRSELENLLDNFLVNAIVVLIIHKPGYCHVQH